MPFSVPGVSTSRDEASSQHKVHTLDVDRGPETEIQCDRVNLLIVQALEPSEIVVGSLPNKRFRLGGRPNDSNSAARKLARMPDDSAT
jgi:hypothetical protein